MSLRNKPYLPLYVQDFLTDEKLNECSAKSTGVYIKIMCVMHKSDEYGKILLKQKDKQGVNEIENFALKLVKHLPFSKTIIEESIKELVEENVLFIEGDCLYQKRMVRDNEISGVRACSGKNGGKKTQDALKFAKAKHKAKIEAKYDNDIDIDIDNEVILNIQNIAKNFFDEKYLNKESLECFDKLIRIDGYTSDQIIKSFEMTKDEFWSQNFLSPLKLRKTDKNKVKYIDIFLKKLNNGTGTRLHQNELSTGTKDYSKGAGL